MTVDNQAHELARPFLVIATQNPIEYEGTYPLPEAQLDRFMVRLALGLSRRRRRGRDARRARRARPRPRPRAGRRRGDGARRPGGGGRRPRAASRCAATSSPSARRRGDDPRVELGASPRAALLLFRAAKALAALEGRDHALPDDVQALAPSVLKHRLLLAPGATEEDREAVVAKRGGAGSGALSADADGALHARPRGGVRARRGRASTRRRCTSPGVALAALVAGSRIWVELACAKRAALERLPGPWSIVEGEPYPLGLRIRRGRLPAAGRARRASARRPPGADRGAPRGALGWSCARCAAAGAGSSRATLVLSDPLGLHTARDPRRPRPGGPGPAADRAGASLRGGGGGPADGTLDGARRPARGAGSDTRAIDFEIDGLRPYRQGSPASRIHWPTVARTGEMVEHRLVAGGDSSPLVVLDSSAIPRTRTRSTPRFARRPRSACTWRRARRLHAAAVGRAPRRSRSTRSSGPGRRSHAHLAMVEAGGTRPALERLSRAETIFWVTAAEASAELGARQAGAPADLVTPFPLPGLDSAFTVAGCHGQRPASRSRARAAVRAA